MTLIIAHRIDNKVTFSSDSRISFDGQGYFDLGIKIFSIPFRLKGPAKTKEDFNKYEYQYDYGLAVIGSSINAYTLKDSIAELLSNLTYLSNASDVSIVGIGAIIFKVYENISKQLSGILREKGLSEILVGGYCIQQNKIRILRFYPVHESNPITFAYEEILPEDGILFFGSGKELGKKIASEGENKLSPLKIIQQVISSNEDNTVGGALQSGAFYAENFKVNGVVEKIINDKKETISKYYLRGFELDQRKSMLEYPYLFVSYGYTQV